MNPSKLAVFFALGTLLSGCADTPHADAAYGKSVKQMVAGQTYDANAANNPAELAPDVGDGERLKNAIDAYRKDVPKGSSEVKQSVVFEVGGSK